MRAWILATRAVVLAIAGCTASPTAPPPAAVRPPGERPAPAGVALDSASSELRLLVYRAGPLAALGHNHVIVNHAVSGTVRIAADGRHASFEIRLPVEGFDVDPPRARAEEGADFPGEIDADARAGTLHNMRSPALLDAERYPFITLAGNAAAGVDGTGLASVRAQLAGRASTFTAPFALTRTVGRIRIRGSANLRQSALGLTPFSALLGALAVRDEFTVKFDLVTEP